MTVWQKRPNLPCLRQSNAPALSAVDGVEGGKKCFKKATVEAGVDSGTVNVHQIVEGIPLRCGLPGPECGHCVEAESYFDRLWQHGNHKKRFFLFVRKVGL